jgi:hypothetical protein
MPQANHPQPPRLFVSTQWVTCPLMRVLCLAAWLVSAQGFGPGLCALVASLDSVHELRVCHQGDGHTTLVLSHENEEETRIPHGLVVNFLMVIAGASPHLPEDHVLSFGSVSKGRATKRGHSAQAKLPTVQRFQSQAPFCLRRAHPHPGRVKPVICLTCSPQRLRVLRC